MQKAQVQHVEDNETVNGKQTENYDLELSTGHENGRIRQPDHSTLTEEHRQYLVRRHGATDLDPIPDLTDRDPYNWPTRKASSLISTSIQHVTSLTLRPHLLENYQLGSGSVSCYDGNIHSICNPVRLCRNSNRLGR